MEGKGKVVGIQEAPNKEQVGLGKVPRGTQRQTLMVFHYSSPVGLFVVELLS